MKGINIRRKKDMLSDFQPTLQIIWIVAFIDEQLL